MREKTVPGLFLERVRNTPRAVAYRAKKLGIYRERTWEDFHGLVASCALGLARLGLGKGERLALLGEPSEEYTLCELSAQSIGAITYGIHPASSQGELEHLIADGRPSVVVAGDQEYLDRVRLLPGSALRRLVVIDTRGIPVSGDTPPVAFDELMEDGRRALSGRPGAFEEMAARVRPDDWLFIAYTSGTQGPPKGVAVSHGRHLAAACALVDRYPVLGRPGRTVVYLPMAGTVGRMAAITLPLLTRLIPHYGEDAEGPGQAFFEVAPTVLFTVPGYLRKVLASVLVGIEQSSGLKRAFYAAAVRIGRRQLERVRERRRCVLPAVLMPVCRYTVFRPILNKIGFDRLGLVLSTGARLPDGVASLFQVYGVNVVDAYALAEAAGGVVSGPEGRFPRPGSVGMPLAGTEVRLSDAGEIQVRGEGISELSWKDGQPDGRLTDVEGWLPTGDIGRWTEDGGIMVLDRLGESPEEGRGVSRALMESALRASPYISRAFVFGREGRLAALVEVDFEALSQWASLRNVPFTGFSGLAGSAAVVEHIGSEIERAGRDAGGRVETFRIIPGVLSPSGEDAPVTPTGKTRREALRRKFAALIESMYERNTTNQGGGVC